MHLHMYLGDACEEGAEFIRGQCMVCTCDVTPDGRAENFCIHDFTISGCGK